jgi:PPOX class probable FMN-dependent enzyme
MTATATPTRIGGAITSMKRLREIIDTPKPDAPAIRKQHATLDAHDRAFIAQAPFLLLATAGSDGRCDVTPRGDAPGFVAVLDERTLVIPDRPGNRRLDTYQNILANPHAGLIFLVPNVEETLRVNGRAWLTEDLDVLGPLAVGGKPPRVGVVLAVEEVYFHCARAFRRARLWQSDSWIARDELPTLGEILHDQLGMAELTADVIDESLAKTNRELY